MADKDEMKNALAVDDASFLEMEAPAVEPATESQSQEQSTESTASNEAEHDEVELETGKTEEDEQGEDLGKDGSNKPETETETAEDENSTNVAGKTTTDDSNIAAKEVDGKPADDKATANTDDKAGEQGKDGKQAAGATAETADKSKPAENQAPDYEALYKEILAPFKANGKTVSLKDISEVKQMLQMGANYTRKMQDIAPHRKALMMLESNGLLDENKLSFLIDLEKKDPQAIKKLIKDSGIDPLEIDLNDGKTYLEGNHKVTDQEVDFQTTLDDLGSNPEGRETLKTFIEWDQASKDVLGNNPSVMTAIHEQRMSGMFDRVAAEVDRQKLLGKIPAGTMFLKAYKDVADRMVASGDLDDLAPKGKEPAAEVPGTKASVPVATRVAAPKAAVTNGDKVSAASPTRSTPKTAKTLVNPLALSDDEFMKQMDNRL